MVYVTIDVGTVYDSGKLSEVSQAAAQWTPEFALVGHKPAYELPTVIVVTNVQKSSPAREEEAEKVVNLNLN